MSRYLRGLLLLMLFTIPLHAISVKMPKNHIEAGQDRTASFIVVNATQSFKAVEIELFKRSHELDGTENRELTEDFLIIPPQLIIGPEQERVCTIQWLGDGDVTSEIPYRIVVEEVPFNKERKNRKSKSDGAVTLRLKFVNSFYVKPKDAKPNLTAQTAEFEDDKIVLTVENKGTEHAILGHFNVNLTNGTTYPLEFKPEGSPFNVLAGQKLKVAMDWPEAIPKQTYQASLKL